MRSLLGFVLALAMPLAAVAQSENILIQMQPAGAYRIWYAEGPSELPEEDVLLLDSVADRAGSKPVATRLGPATARLTEQGTIVELAGATRDARLLIDRDACGHLKTWHAEGGIALTDDQATDLVMSALPGGGQRLVLGPQRYAKAFLTSLGIMVAIWKPRVVEK